jgi:hypothetical protein
MTETTDEKMREREYGFDTLRAENFAGLHQALNGA